MATEGNTDQLQNAIANAENNISPTQRIMQTQNAKITQLEKTKAQLLILNDYLIYNLQTANFEITDFHNCLGEPAQNTFTLRNGREMDWTCNKCGYHRIVSVNAEWQMGAAPEGLKK